MAPPSTTPTPSRWTVTNTNQAARPSTRTADRTDAEGDVIIASTPAPPIADGDTLTYAATGLPAGLTIDPTSGVISGTLSSISAGRATTSP